MYCVLYYLLLFLTGLVLFDSDCCSESVSDARLFVILATCKVQPFPLKGLSSRRKNKLELEGFGRIGRIHSGISRDFVIC